MTDQELEIYYRQMNALFRTEGWQTFITDLQGNVENIDSIEGAKDNNDLYFRKGQLNILGAILNLEETTRFGQEESQRSLEDV